MRDGRIEPRLVERLNISLEWCRVSLMTLPTLAHHLESEEVDGPVTVLDKFVIETALFISVAARACDGDQLPLVRELAARCSTFLHSPRMISILARFPRAAPSFGLAHSALGELGFDNKTFSDVLRELFLSGDVEASERVSYRGVETQWVRHRLGLSTLFDPWKGSVQTNAAASSHGMTMSMADYYAVTHTVMYLTDFGRQELPTVLSAHSLSRIIRSGVVCTFVAENLDVLAELLLSAVAARMRLGIHECFALQMLLAVWEEFGFLPSPTLRPAELGDSHSTASTAYALRHTYHTNYVGGMLAAVMLNHRPQHTFDEAHLTPGTLRNTEPRLLLQCGVETLLAASTPGRQLECLKFAEVSGLDDSVLAQILGDAAIVHNVRRHNLSGLRDLARAWVESRVPPSCLLSSALEGALREVRFDTSLPPVLAQELADLASRVAVFREAPTAASESKRPEFEKGFASTGYESWT